MINLKPIKHSFRCLSYDDQTRSVYNSFLQRDSISQCTSIRAKKVGIYLVEGERGIMKKYRESQYKTHIVWTQVPTWYRCARFIFRVYRHGQFKSIYIESCIFARTSRKKVEFAQTSCSQIASHVQFELVWRNIQFFMSLYTAVYTHNIIYIKFSFTSRILIFNEKRNNVIV